MRRSCLRQAAHRKISQPCWVLRKRRAAHDVQGGWTEDETQGAYVLEAVLDETPRQAGEMRTAHFVVTAADGDTVLYELDTQKYIGG